MRKTKMVEILLIITLGVLFSFACGKKADKPVDQALPPETVAAGGNNSAASGIDNKLAERLATIFSGQQIADMAAYRAAVAGIKDSATFTSAYNFAERLSAGLSKTLQEFDNKKYEQAETGQEAAETGSADYNWVLPAVPGMVCDFYGEGSVPALDVDKKFFKARSEGTCPSFSDYYDLLALCYEGNDDGIWPKWNVREWDYGGANSLGDGTHLVILTAVDKILEKEAPFNKDKVLKIRTEVLKNIVDGDEYFGYHDPQAKVSDEQWLANIQAEIDKILGSVKLSDAERTALVERKQKPFPRDAKEGG